MKALVLGGCGAQALPAVEDLIASEEISHVTIGDIDQEKANQLAAKLKSPKLSTLKVDVNDHPGLVDCVKGADIVLNCTGPYHLLGVKVLKAAIEAGKHYVDYCDDYDATLDMLELDGAAKEKGVTAIIGLGASPGLCNLMAKHGADKLDSTDEIRIFWVIAEGEPEGPAVLDHMFHMVSGDVPQFLNGKMVDVPGLSGAEEIVEFPAPHGALPVFYVGHPEPITLSRVIPGVKTVVNKGALPGEMIGLFQGLKELGLMGSEPVSVKGQNVSPRDVLVTLMASAPQLELPPEETLSAMVIQVTGMKDGNPVTLEYAGLANMAPCTSLPASLGVRMLARGEVKETGVLPPEACLDLGPFQAMLKKRGLADFHEKATVKAPL
jgi:saccharopine dehydrogenase-like NADP-dependent oxidoreductase